MRRSCVLTVRLLVLLVLFASDPSDVGAGDREVVQRLARLATWAVGEPLKTVFVIFVPPGSDVAANVAQFQAALARSDLRGATVVVGSEDGPLIAEVAVQIFSKLPAGSARGSRVVFVGLPADRGRVEAAVQSAGAEFVFTEYQAPSKQPPPAPGGFSWRDLPDIGGAILMPDGWFFKRVAKGSTASYFVSVENIDQRGRFVTGLSLNVLPRLKAHAAESFAKGSSASVAAKSDVIKSWHTSDGVLRRYGTLTKLPPKDSDPAVLVHTVFIANVRTNTVYVLSFEGPENEWTTLWKTGAKMVDDLLVDEAY